MKIDFPIWFQLEIHSVIFWASLQVLHGQTLVNTWFCVVIWSTRDSFNIPVISVHFSLAFILWIILFRRRMAGHSDVNESSSKDAPTAVSDLNRFEGSPRCTSVSGADYLYSFLKMPNTQQSIVLRLIFMHLKNSLVLSNEYCSPRPFAQFSFIHCLAIFPFWNHHLIDNIKRKEKKLTWVYMRALFSRMTFPMHRSAQPPQTR